MCEYCGCQAVRAIEELTREHDHVVAMISEVRAAYRAGDLAGMAQTARQIAAVLGPHTAVEERGLFPPLAAEFGDHVATLQAEHERIEAVLAESATSVPTDPTWPGRLLDTLHLLREHILAEQDGVFPAALSRLDPADWEVIDALREHISASQPKIAYGRERSLDRTAGDERERQWQ